MIDFSHPFIHTSTFMQIFKLNLNIGGPTLKIGVNDSRIQKLEFRSSGMVTTKNVKIFALFAVC